jgi:hypothetical protein
VFRSLPLPTEITLHGRQAWQSSCRRLRCATVPRGSCGSRLRRGWRPTCDDSGRKQFRHDRPPPRGNLHRVLENQSSMHGEGFAPRNALARSLLEAFLSLSIRSQRT